MKYLVLVSHGGLAEGCKVLWECLPATDRFKAIAVGQKQVSQ